MRMKDLPILISAVLCVVTLSCCAADRNFGVQDAAIEKKISRANTLAEKYKNKDFRGIEAVLVEDCRRYQKDGYARLHLLNELAELYSHYLLNIEKAVEMDEALLATANITAPTDYRFEHDAANNLLLHAKRYREDFINISNEEILKKANKRIARNRELLLANPNPSETSYDRIELERVYKDVLGDLAKTYPGSPERYRLQTRLMRVDYELLRNDGGSVETLRDAWAPLLSGTMTLDDLYFSEANFLLLAEYFDAVYEKTKNLSFARYSLELTYKPYINIQNEENRFRYNKLVNMRINRLIDGNFQAADYTQMFYYVTLNKSRMILEEKLKSKDDFGNYYRVDAADYDSALNLPNINYFKKKISGMHNYLDFYFQNHPSATLATGSGAVSQKSATHQPVITDAGNNALQKLYITSIKHGELTVRVLNRTQIDALKQTCDARMAEICTAMEMDNRSTLSVCRDNPVVSGSPQSLARNRGTNQQPGNSTDLDFFTTDSASDRVSVSADGWLSLYPLSYIFDKRIAFTLNALTQTNDTGKIPEKRIIGYFNPTGDLVEAEGEKSAISSLFPDSRLFSSDQANLQTLREDIPGNIMHLSMHGYHFSSNPENSLLAFAGSIKESEKETLRGITLKKNSSAAADTPSAKNVARVFNFNHALQAKDMHSYGQLKNKDLVFTAACRTGVTEKAATNDSEILGILRPLLLNNNKNIILTLWDVPSESAALFVTSFYKNLAESSDIQHSFLSARETVRETFPAPLHWAPYYLVQSM